MKINTMNLEELVILRDKINYRIRYIRNVLKLIKSEVKRK